ncbi:branched-chain amino acid ABC transporter substrate-binding protein [Pseudoroseomonas wenyumeiae]|uniref:Branched-chain amino acid ABC transporter substrate-binding protein n=1 Tax=Teichococcus wenyumeiae TaxID=2478470 RepID=A0A3A9JM20_9PROT|nr:ABC transporter substrate-binding protein [Pseudoroseomonas wenyumeiae]RKK06211.1 branched-chain amino acid ABC transporter substrate-binding protein [Pseudoroseomonas wenyumeiae]RMI19711.1 branched-chain amino acid ABC transporter substrate-binding protein [Pseudoroseomonas wenyumeiae]
MVEDSRQTGRVVPRRTALAMGLGAAGAVALGARPARAQGKPVQVALLAPMSGPWARQGMLMRLGADMAIDEINASGGIKALGGAKMELVVFDAGDSAEKAKNAAQRMVAQYPDLVGGTGAWFSSFTLAVTEVTERAELPWLTLSYSDLITNRGFRYVFQMAPTADDQAIKALPTILQLAKQAAGSQPTTIGLIAGNDASAASLLRPIRATELEKHKLRAVVDETYTPPLSDATSIVQRVRSARPQFLLCVTSNVPDTKLLMDKFAEYRLSGDRLPKIGNGGALGAPELGQVVGPQIIEGLMGIVANWGGKGQAELSKRFTEKTGEPWLNQDSIMTYTDMMILREATERAGVADRRKVAEAMRNFDLTDGVALLSPGGRLKFDEKGRRVGAELVIIQWQAGKAVAVYPPSVATAEPIWPRV